ncbi:MAG: hypothetical protein HYS15_02840, partial [Candidatus Spechtbacteria bacterium]|nr:hypothetical protein [Candidatus Spechtbacteria bacterium]
MNIPLKKKHFLGIVVSTITTIVLSTGIVFAAVTVSTNVNVGAGTPNLTLNGDDMYVTGTFETDGYARLDGRLFVTGAASTTGDFGVGGNATTTASNGNFATAGGLTVSGTTTLSGYSVLAGALNVIGAASTTGNLIVGGSFVVGGNATTSGSTGNLDIAGALTVNGATVSTFTGAIRGLATLSAGTGLYVTGTSTFSGLGGFGSGL